MGYDVYVVDNSKPHLERLQKRASLLFEDGAEKVHSIFGDATKPFEFKSGSFDAALNAGFGYLMPSDVIGAMFENTADVVKPDGLLVFEFATNRDRQDEDGNPIVGEKEQNYSKEEGWELLESLYNGFSDVSFGEKKIDFEGQYFTLRADLIIASGRKGQTHTIVEFS
jgi:SAM-dependent methyltransferase